MNLVRAELSRLAARRFVRVLAVLLPLAFAITIATTLASSSRPSPERLAEAEHTVQLERDSVERYRAECQAAQAPGTPDTVREQYPPGCRGITTEHIRPENYLNGVFIFAYEIRPLVMLLAAFLALFGFLIAASYAGAELTSGGMTNLLLWRPERGTVLGAKLGTVLGAVLAASVLSTVLYVGAFWLIAKTSGLPGPMPAHEWASLALLTLRGVGLALVATAIGFAVATLGRHTAAALGLAAAYAVVWEIGARVVLEVVEARRPELWMLSSYLGAWENGRLDFWDSTGCYSGDDYCTGQWSLSWWHGGVVLAVLLALFVGGAFVTFRRRDLA